MFVYVLTKFEFLVGGINDSYNIVANSTFSCYSLTQLIEY